MSAVAEPPSAVQVRGAQRRIWMVLIGGVIGVYPFALVLLVWWLLTATHALSPFALPTPNHVFTRARELSSDGTLWDATRITFERVLMAWLLAVAVGATIGILIGRIRLVRLALRPIVGYLFPTPKIALYPAMLILLGFGTTSKVALGFIEALFPILLATAAASSQVDASLVWSARALGTSQSRALRRVILPASVPGIMTGARIGLVGAMAGTFLAELIAGSDGLGHMMTAASRLLAISDMYVAMITMSLGGLLLDRLFLLLRSRALAWSHEVA
jgi:ABC-type nitrate/sulfonate/bicarbonate transport system permease component